MAHRVRLDRSFRNISSLERKVQDEMGAIVKGLERDPRFEPDPNDYLVQRVESNGECCCRRLQGWGNWQLIWFYEYSKPSPYFERTVEGIVVMLLCQPLELQTLQPRHNKRP